ncbi:MAG: eight transrane protein EpsH, partial [Rhodospirillales bacterium]|nr:eight transrane protein EpsH [Rhodospirillales bacterium]
LARGLAPGGVMALLDFATIDATPRRAAVWRAVLATLVVALALFALFYPTEIAGAVRVWDQSTAYTHCWLILPIVAYLLWERRRELQAWTPSPTVWPLLLVPVAAALWLLAQRAGILEGRQLALMLMLQAVLASLLGPRFWRAFIFELLYLFFLIPTGEFLVPSLQNFTRDFIVAGLNLMHVPVFYDATMIEIPEGRFFVAEACAGLRFLIASVAFGSLYAYLIFRSWKRRLIFFGVSLIVPIFANGVRALGIVLVGHWLGSAQAAATDHVLYGWMFFTLVLFLLIALGLPFRESRRVNSPIPVPTAAPRARLPVIAMAALLLVALPQFAARALSPQLRIDVLAGARIGKLEAHPAGERLFPQAPVELDLVGDGVRPGSLRLVMAPDFGAIKPELAVDRDHDGEPIESRDSSQALTVDGVVLPAQRREFQARGQRRVLFVVPLVEGKPAALGGVARLRAALMPSRLPRAAIAVLVPASENAQDEAITLLRGLDPLPSSLQPLLARAVR